MPHLKKLKIATDMCERPLLKKIIVFSLPIILTGVLQLLYNAADIVVVGQFASEFAMAAVGSTGALVNLLTNLFIGLAIGALAATAHWIGAKNEKRVHAIVHTSMLVSLIGGIIIGVLGFFASKFLLELMQTTSDILPLSTIYLQIFFIGMPFNSIYNFGSSILRAGGDTKRPLIFLTVAGLINIALNLLFVIVFQMSVAGVALATIISQAVSAVLVVICLMKKKDSTRLSLKLLRIDKAALKEIIQIGLPAGIQSTIFSFSNVIIQSSINSMGSLAVAGNAAAANIEGFVYISMNAVSQAALTFTSQNYGAGKKENLNLILFQCTLLAGIVGIVMGYASFFAGSFLVSLYNRNSSVIAFGVERLAVIGSTYFLCGIMEVVVGSLRGVGKSVLPMAVSIIGVCGVRILWILTVFNSTKNLFMLYVSYPISWLFTLLVHFACFIIVRKRMKKQDAKLVENTMSTLQ